MTKKGLYKLITKPHVFVRDYFKKKEHKFKYLIPKKKVTGEYKYTVVSAVYGVEKYLDDYFKSLVHQTLDFKKHIYLVMVDDGSLDSSADIIKKWQKKYPDNILYLKKENGGQASARNYGLDYVKTEWVTFIDPDDFVNDIYFEEIDKFLVKHNNRDFSMVSNNFIFFYEKSNKYSDTHPLKYRFKKPENIVSSLNLKGNVQLSVCMALFRKSILKDNSLYFDLKIQPSFEDANFILKYFLYTYFSNMYIGFLKKPTYFYRKRADLNSTLDTAWMNPKTFDDVLQYGCSDFLEESRKRIGYIPKEYQKTVLYHLSWQIKRIVNNESTLSFLTDSEIETYKKRLIKIFTYIDNDVIEAFNLSGYWFYHKVALLGLFKASSLHYQIVYIDGYDKEKNLIKLKYFSWFKSEHLVLLDNKETLPAYFKIKRDSFLKHKFVDEYILWIPIENTQMLNIYIDNKDTKISLGGKQFSEGVEIERIKQYFISKKLLNVSKLPRIIKQKRKVYQNEYFKNKFKDAWLFMDRDMQGDDNAEHLYRFIQKNHPNINIFFILSKKSEDWKRLKKDAFNLLDFASIEHGAALVSAKHMISSDASKNCINYLDNKYYRDLLNYKFTFLQHGITKDDLSSWLNSKDIDCFITAAQREYDSIVGNENHYKFSEKEVFLTGFSRHDLLIKKNNTKTKTIMIMPTWRNYLNDLEKNDINFIDTPFASAWISLLNSDILEQLHKEQEYNFILFPHPNLEKYITQLKVPSYISILVEEKKSIQYYFQSSSLLLTDYSSVAFEMGILQKETIYYHFDHKEIFSGIHTYAKGYFDYQKDAFGPICYTKEEVCTELKSFVENRGQIEKKYLNRIDNFFAFHDTHNSQRVYDKIVTLHRPYQKNIDFLALEKSIEKLYENKRWKSLESRTRKLLDSGYGEYAYMLIEAKLNLGQVEEAEKLLKSLRLRDEEKINYINALKNRLSSFVMLNEEEKTLLVSESKDFFTSLRFGYLKKLFNSKYYQVCSVAFELFDMTKLDEGQKKESYYMWGKSLFFVEKYSESLEKFEKYAVINKEISIFKAKSMTYLRKWEESYELWLEMYTKYPSYNRSEVLKNIILALKNLQRDDELEKYQSILLKSNFLDSLNLNSKIDNRVED